MKKFWDLYHSEVPAFLIAFSETAEMQRLQDIGMNCGCEYTSFAKFNNCKKYSRYTHSVGVALIVWHFTKDIKQTIAGLLHDIATPVFAHTIDFLNKDHEKQESTEAKTKDIIANSSEIMSLLRQYGLDLEQVCDYHLYPIADNDAPKLSADRLEYSLGNMVNYGFTDFVNAERFYRDLIVVNNEDGEEELAFQTEQTAVEFTENVFKNSHLYISDEDRFAMQKLADLIAFAIEKKVITIDDLYQTETEVIAKLRVHSLTNARWEEYRNYTDVKISTENRQHAIKISAKKRYINPLVKGKGRLADFSEKISDEIKLLQALDFDYYLYI